MSSKKNLIIQHVRALPTSRARKQFDLLASKLRVEIPLREAWRDAQRQALELARTELSDAKQAHDQRLKQLVVLLDQKHGEAGLDDWEQERLSSFLADTALDLLEQEDDDELDVIYQRHNDDYEEEDAIYQAEFKEIMHEIFDIEIDDDVDMRTPEARASVRELMERDGTEEAPRHGSEQASLDAERTQHAAQLQQVSDALLRELQTCLGNSHDMDEQLMQRVAAACSGGHLWELLALRFELEQCGLAPHFSEKQISECNKLLKEELRISERENAWYVREFELERPQIAPAHLTPQLMLHALKNTIKELREVASDLERELIELQDTKKLAAWLERLDEEEDL